MHLGISKAQVAAPLVGILACVMLVTLSAKDVPAALGTLLTGAFSSAYYAGSLLNTAAFLMLSGTGAAVALKGGGMNLGGEGQIYAGGFAAGWILTTVSAPSPLVFCLALAASLFAGAALSCISAALKETRGASVLLTSFLVSAAVIPLIDAAITGSRSGADQNLLALAYIPKQFEFPRILPPSPLAPSFFISLAFCAASYFFLYRTKTGKRLSIWGTAPGFAEYSGFSSAANSFMSLGISGALHALTGFFAVCGTYYTCHKGFYSGMGWNALTAALIASSNPLALIPASLVLSWLYTSADIVSLTQGFQFDISGIVQGVVLFAIAIPSFKAGASK